MDSEAISGRFRWVEFSEPPASFVGEVSSTPTFELGLENLNTPLYM